MGCLSAQLESVKDALKFLETNNTVTSDEFWEFISQKQLPSFNNDRELTHG